MNVTVFLEQRFKRLDDGSVWTDALFPYEFWTRYLDVFDAVTIVSRAEQVRQPPDKARRVDGEGVRLFPVPHYLGPEQFLTRLPHIRARLRALDRDGAFILRVPSILAFLFLPRLKASGGRYPYGVEVVADPALTLSSTAISHWALPLFRAAHVAWLKRSCRHAAAAAYVTDRTLQDKYPPAAGAFHTGCSDVILEPRDFADEDATAERSLSGNVVVTVANMSVPYKGIDVLLRAARLCRDRGRRLRLIVVGEGRLRPAYQELAAELGLGEDVEFTGALPAGRAVFEQLDRADLFALPSRAEGMPRALIEAMARGLPCVAARVGGVPELLDRECLVPPDAPEPLADKITAILDDEARRRLLALRNLYRAKDFQAHLLRAKRDAFLEHLRDATENRRQAA